MRLTVYDYCFQGCDTIFTDTKISEDSTPSISSPHNTQQGGAVQEFPNTYLIIYVNLLNKKIYYKDS